MREPSKMYCVSSLIINKIDLYDLEIFLNISDEAYGKNGTQGMGLEEVDNFLINAGLCSAETNSVRTVPIAGEYKSDK